MKARLAVLGMILGIAMLRFSWEPGRAIAPASAPPERTAAAPFAPSTAPPSSPAPFDRDPFRFANEGSPAPAIEVPSEPVAASPPPEPALARLRLVGLLRRAGALQAAVVVDGELVLASAGDTVGSLTFLSVGPEGVVRVRDSFGLETTLALPEEP